MPNINKIFEKLLYNRLNDFFESSNIISETQYDFRKSRDTQLASLKLLNLLLPVFQSNSKYAACVFLDFSKAFDTVDHSLLLKKLEKYGIRGSALQLLRSYLSNRTMAIKINDKTSRPVSISIGVPQGSCLGPLFYLIYANNLQNLIENLTSVVFADDTTIVESSDSIEVLTLRLNFLMSKIVYWSNFNKLSLNKAKTKWMLFTNKTVQVPKIFIHGTEIERVDKFKYLEIIIDNKLKYRSHLTQLRTKLSQLRYVTYKIKPLINVSAAKSFYYSMVESKLSYGLLVWGGTRIGCATFLKLCRLQDKIVFNLFATSNDTFESVSYTSVMLS